MDKKSINRIYLGGAVFLAVFLLSGCMSSKEKQQLEQQKIEQEEQTRVEEIRKECETTARKKADEEYNKRAEAIANAKPVEYSKTPRKDGYISDYEFQKENDAYNKKIGRTPLSDEDFNKAKTEVEYKEFLDSCLEEKGINK